MRATRYKRSNVISKINNFNLREILIISSLTIILILTGCSYVQLRKTEGVVKVKDWPINFAFSIKPENYNQEFVNIINAIDKWYAHKDRKNIKIETLRNKYLDKLKLTENKYDFEMLLIELFAELHNDHSNVFTTIPEFGLPILCDLIEGQIVITYFNQQQLCNIDLDSQSFTENVGIGWIVKEIDRQPAREWLKSRFSIISASTEQSYWQQSLEWVFLRYQTEVKVREYLLLGPGGEQERIRLSLNIPESQINTKMTPTIESKHFGNVGYIAINTMKNGIVDEFDQAMKSMLDKKSLILDLRKNNGGNSVNGEEMIKRLIQRKTSIWHDKKLVPNREINYDGRVIVLIGPETFSAAESFAFNLHDSDRVTTMGEKSRGDSGGGPVLFRTDEGIYFRFPVRGLDYSLSGQQMEGRGLTPHLELTQSYQDLLAGKDTILEAALKFLKDR